MPEERLPPPHDFDAEEAVLGSILLNNDTFPDVLVTGLRPDCFVEGNYSIIYKACLELHEGGKAIDEITLAHHLMDDGKLELIGGVSTLTRLISITPSSLSAGYYAKILCDMAAKRMLISAAGQIAQSGYDPAFSIDEGLDRAEELILSIRGRLANTISRRIRLIALRKLTSEPPEYEATINGTKFKLSAGVLMDYGKVAAKVMEALDFVPRYEKKETWSECVNTLLQRLKRSETPTSASVQAELKLAIKRGLQKRREGTEYEDIAAGCYIERQHNSRVYWFFQPQWTIQWLKRYMGKTYTTSKLWSIMEDWGGIEAKIELGNDNKKRVKLWGLPPDFADKVEFSEEEEPKIPDWL